MFIRKLMFVVGAGFVFLTFLFIYTLILRKLKESREARARSWEQRRPKQMKDVTPPKEGEENF